MKILQFSVWVFILLLIENFGLYSQKYSYFPYYTNYKRVNILEYENPESDVFSKDERGIIKSNGYYHPASVSTYGILCYDQFKLTGDSTYFLRCINQVKYYEDFQVSRFDGKGIVYTYLFDFKEMKSPWISGLAQGAALSYLLRYQDLTGDTSVNTLMHKIVYAMLMPVGKGGTLGKTPEGFPWIEEYPGSGEAPQVLNGGIIAFIGLWEYCQKFPDQKNANQIKDQFLNSIKTCIPFYDTFAWTSYDRSMQHDCTPEYIRMEIHQMQHLYVITGDPFFLKQQMIWSTMAWEKPVSEKLHVYLKRNYNYAVPVTERDSKWLVPEQKWITDYVSELPVICKTEKEIKELTGFKAKEFMNENTKCLVFELEKPLLSDFFILQSDENCRSIEPLVIGKNGKKVEGNQKTTVQKESSGIAVYVDQPIEMKYVLFRMDCDSQNDSMSAKCFFFNTNNTDQPVFAFYNHEVVELKKGNEYRISVPFINTDQITLFFRSSDNADRIVTEKWAAQNTLGNTFIAHDDVYVEIMVVYRFYNPLSKIGKPIIERVSENQK